MNTPDYISQLKDLFEQKPTEIIYEIASKDEMFLGKEKHYFNVGQSALQCVKLAMLAAGKQDFKNILDLPCGHGRVLRMLKAAFPQAKLTACDLNQDGVDFCVKVFGATGIYSTEDVNQIPIQPSFDLIWCGSLLTHLNSSSWTDFLNLFNSLLCPGGILIFTANGDWVAHRIGMMAYSYGLDPNKLPILVKDYDTQGFGYLDYPNLENYGISLSSPSWVLSQLQKIGNLRLLTYTERGWDNHQDAIACIRVDY